MKYYNVKIKFESEELKKNGEPKIIISNYLVHDETADAAIAKTREYLRGTVLSYEISNVAETKIEAVVN